MRGVRVALAELGLSLLVLTPTLMQHPVLDGRRLRQRSDTFAQYLISESDNDTTRAGNVVVTLKSDGKALTLIYLAVEDPVLKQADTMVQALADLTPISHVTHSTGGAGAIRFDRAQVDGWLQLGNGDTIALNTPLAATTYNAATFDLLVRASDLRDGAALALSGFRLQQNAVVPLRGRVTGTEVIDGRPCWVFRGTNGTLPVTFWIDKETRDLRRQLLQMGVFSHLLGSLPPGEVATLTDDELDGLVLSATGVRHRTFGFAVPFPSSLFAPDEDMEDALRGMLGQRRDAFVWTYRIPGDSIFAVAVLVHKGFDGTQEGFRRVVKEILPTGRTGDEALYADSIYWEGQRREYRVTSRDKRGVTSNLRCIPSPAPRRPGIIACVLLAGGYSSQIQMVRDGFRFTTSEP